MLVCLVNGRLGGKLRLMVSMLVTKYAKVYDVCPLYNLIVKSELYLIYKDGALVGFVTGIEVSDDIWFADKVYLEPEARRDFKSVIEYFKRLKLQQGYKYITTLPSQELERLYSKHNLMKSTRI